MDFPIGDVGPTPDEGDEPEDRAEEVRYRPADIFTDVIDEEYQSEVTLDYDDQDGGEDHEEEDYEDDEFYEEEPPLRGSDEVAIEDRYEHGESSHTYKTRS